MFAASTAANSSPLGSGIGPVPSLPGALNWQQVQDRFRASNPTLKAGVISIGESRAQEITAHLRPNPTFNAQLDQATLFDKNPYQPLHEAYPNITFNYLHERDHKRELRTDSAKQGTRDRHFEPERPGPHAELFAARRFCADAAGEGGHSR